MGGWEANSSEGKRTGTCIEKSKHSSPPFFIVRENVKRREHIMRQGGWSLILPKVTVRVFATFREIIGLKEIEVDLPTDATVISLIDFLSKNYSHGKLKKEVFDRNGNIRKFVKILVNGRDTYFLSGPSTQLNDGDIVAMFPPVGGG